MANFGGLGHQFQGEKLTWLLHSCNYKRDPNGPLLLAKTLGIEHMNTYMNKASTYISLQQLLKLGDKLLLLPPRRKISFRHGDFSFTIRVAWCNMFTVR